MSLFDDSPFSHEEFSCDSMLRGELTLFQPKIGYRFSIDPLLLSDFVGVPPYGNVLDVGAGVGIIGLLLKYKDPQAQVSLVELQPRLAMLCRENARKNLLSVEVIEGDFLDLAIQKKLQLTLFDLIVSCPPYYKPGAGKVCPNEEEALARHDVRLPPEQFLSVAKKLLKPKGCLALVYPSWRFSELLSLIYQHGLQPISLRFVHSKLQDVSQRVLLLVTRGTHRELKVEPPLIIREQSGTYTEETKRILGE